MIQQKINSIIAGLALIVAAYATYNIVPLVLSVEQMATSCSQVHDTWSKRETLKTRLMETR